MKTKEESLEEMCSRASGPAGVKHRTKFSRLMKALECLLQGIDGKVDQKIERFLVDIRNVRSIPPVLTEVLAKLVRLCGCSTEGRSEEPSQKLV